MHEVLPWWQRRMPGAPVTEPWDFSAAALVNPLLPAKLRRLPGLLDRFGAVRLAPSTIGIDNARAVPWTQVTEVHTRPVGEIAAALTEDLAGQIARLVPIPGAGFATRAVTSRIVDAVSDLVTGMLRTALREHREHAQVPWRIGCRGRWKSTVLSPGLVSSAVLCLPPVATSVIATASQHGIAITAPQGRL
ncbi:hypothetical protein [Actinophytocola oryzae]|uniref:hypothetical protein n=1 Tax=Actinophytocola oryzae TaxID=502181 RepID=UPI001062C6B3|nr:hypothetical protein [Actinophytocola oryzae]